MSNKRINKSDQPISPMESRRAFMKTNLGRILVGAVAANALGRKLLAVDCHVDYLKYGCAIPDEHTDWNHPNDGYFHIDLGLYDGHADFYHPDAAQDGSDDHINSNWYADYYHPDGPTDDLWIKQRVNPGGHCDLAEAHSDYTGNHTNYTNHKNYPIHNDYKYHQNTFFECEHTNVTHHWNNVVHHNVPYHSDYCK